MMKTLLVVLFLLTSGMSAFGQVVLYSTDFGNSTTLPLGWSFGGPQASNLQISTATASSGYNYPVTASAGSNLLDGGLAGTATANISGQINTTGYTSIQVSFGARKTSTYSGAMQLAWSSDGTNYNNISFTDVVNDANWASVNSSNWITLPAGASNQANLQFRLTFTRTNGAGNYYIDDFTVQGYSSSGSLPTDYFRSKQTGNWNSSSNWESSPDNAAWITATLIPNSSANAILIRNGHTISINAPTTADQLTIEPGGTLSHPNSQTFTLNNGSGVDMTVNGIYIINGEMPSGAGTYTVESGGIIRVDGNTGGNSDNIAFSTNSNVLFKTGSIFQWNSTLSFGTLDITYFSSATEKPIFRVTANGVTVGAGSQTTINGLLEVNGTVTWESAGTKTFRDGITGTGTITQSSTSGALIISGSTDAILGGGGIINLNNGGLQIASGASVLLTENKPVNGSNFINYGTLECQTFVITGSTTFTNANSAELLIGSPQGITASGATGNIQTTGRVFNSNASYTYNANVDQATGTGLPLTVSILSISSTDLTGSNTITLTNNNTTVTNSFNLNNGFFAAGVTGNLQIATGGTIFGLGGHNPDNASAGNIVFLGNGSTIGTLTGYPRLYSVIINGAVDFNGPGAQSATILNKLQLNSGSSVSDAPYYQGGSSLVYSTGGTYNRNVEWGSASNQGYPYHVTVQGGTIVNLNSNPINPAQLELGGDLTIGNINGSGQVYLNNNMAKALSVKGNLIIGSTDLASNGSMLQLSSNSGGDLWLYGDFTRYNNSSYNDNERAIFFKGNENTSISTPNVTITPGVPTQYFSYALMDKTSGTETVTLNCPVGIDHSMTFTKGIVVSTTNYPLVFIDNSTVSSASDLSFVNGPVKKIGDDGFTFPVGKPLLENPSVGGYRYIAINPVSNTSSTDAFTAEFIQASATALGPITAVGLRRVSRCEYWKLDKTNGAANLAVDITASWAARSNCNVVGSVPYISDLPTLVLAHFDGSNWNSYGSNSRTGNVTSGSITWNNVTEFSPFSLGSTDFLENLLPLDVSGFAARARTTDVAIDWMVSNNNEQDEFILERSHDGVNFETLKVVPVKIILFTAAYAEVDTHPFNGWSYYRLRVVDKVGREKVSHIAKVWFGREQHIRVSPNPASEKIIVSFAEPSSISQIELVNISGQVLQRIQTIQFNNKVDISHLQAGMYYLRITGKNGLSTKSFIKQ